MNMDNNLDYMIKQSGLPKKVIAERKGITPETLSRHIHGKIQLTLNDAEEYADFLSCRPQDIMFRSLPIDIIAYSVIFGDGKAAETMPTGTNKDCPKGQVWLNEQYTDDVAAIIYKIDKGYVGPWIQYRDSIGLVDLDPIKKGIVSKDCIERSSYAKIKNGPVMFGYVYPEPRGGHSLYDPWADTEMLSQKTFLEGKEAVLTGLDLEWATPLISSVWRPELRGAVIEYEAA